MNTLILTTPSLQQAARLRRDCCRLPQQRLSWPELVCREVHHHVVVSGGRAAALEIMIGTSAVKNLIREGKIHQLPSVIQTSQNVGMRTMEMSLLELLANNLITGETALEKGLDPKLVQSSEQENHAMQ